MQQQHRRCQVCQGSSAECTSSSHCSCLLVCQSCCCRASLLACPHDRTEARPCSTTGLIWSCMTALSCVVQEDEVEAFGDQPGSPSPRNGQRNQLGGLQPGTNRWDEGSAQPPPLLQQQTGPSRWDAGSGAQAGSNRLDAGSAKAQQGGASSRLQNMTNASRQHVDAPATGTRYDGGKTSWTPEPKAATQHHQASEEDSPVVVSHIASSLGGCGEAVMGSGHDAGPDAGRGGRGGQLLRRAAAFRAEILPICSG